jgi:hypothetical protein
MVYAVGCVCGNVQETRLVKNLPGNFHIKVAIEYEDPILAQVAALEIAEQQELKLTMLTGVRLLSRMPGQEVVH